MNKKQRKTVAKILLWLNAVNSAEMIIREGKYTRNFMALSDFNYEFTLECCELVNKLHDEDEVGVYCGGVRYLHAEYLLYK